jgi:hypothetical protein
MRRLVITATATVAMLAMLIAPASVLANNDPHRTYFDNAPFDLDTTFCPFPVHVESPFQAEYGTTSTLPDGSTVIRVSGPLFIEVTNTSNGKAVIVNASGSGTVTISPDGYTVTYDSHGRSLWYGPNLAAFGLPSGIVAVAGPLSATFVFEPDGTFTATAFAGSFRVMTDVCAAIS